MWKCTGMALQLNMNCLITAKNEEFKICVSGLQDAAASRKPDT